MSIENVIWSLFSDYIKENDVNQDLDPANGGRGFLQRYNEMQGQELDENLLPKIDNLTAYTHDPSAIVDTLVPIREQSLGLRDTLYDDIVLRKKLLQYLKKCSRNKGTLQNYIFLLGQLGFDVFITENYANGRWDDGYWDTGKWDSYANINGTFDLTLAKRFSFVTTPAMEAQIARIIEWNKPIHAVGYTYTIVEFERPIVQLIPTSLSFSNVVEGQQGTLTFQIHNIGTSNLVISNIVSSSTVFTVSWTSGTIAPGGSQTVTVTFAPLSVNTFTGNLTITSNATPTTNTLPLAGTSIAATRIIGVSPTTLAFGNVEVSNSLQLTFTINNTGNSPLSVTSFTFPFASYTASWTSGTIAAGGSQLVTVTYAPTISGAQNGSIGINSNATSGTNTVAVTATATITRAMYGDGVNNVLTTDESLSYFSFIQNTKVFTISFWIKPNATPQSNKGIMGNLDTSTDKGFFVLFDSQSLVLAVSNGSGGSVTVTKTGFFTTTDLIHVAITCDGTTGGTKFYKNGVLQTGLSGTLQANGTGNSTRKIKIFNTNSATFDYFVFATLQRIKIYNVTLDQTQITQLYNKEEVTSGLVFNMNMNAYIQESGIVYIPETVANLRGRVGGILSGNKFLVDPATNADLQLYP